MITSMTGYGRSSIAFKHGRFVIEVQSLNRKHLESFVALPKELARFEIEIKKWIAEQIQRGQISLRVTSIIETKEIKDLLPDVDLLKEFQTGWYKIAKALNFSKEDISLSFLTSQLQSFMAGKQLDEEKTVRKILQEGVSKALSELIEMKRKEGSILKKDLSKRMSTLKKIIKQIEVKSPLAAEKYRQRLEKRLEEFLEDKDTDERILREIAIFSEKIDITEEITRFKSHLEQFSSLLSEKEEVKGRKMDFLIQELVRETNTIASKSSDVSISKAVIEIKAELEKIREQVQNIE
ncbi:MAG: YicC family protein [Chlamydiae bacterium CG10_big_fil_rev_8_21_14_0_10_35_9]|nr:MAG: YicC family protein [Chlamydiae bacterium CG10_big_fil_rev_8_21_14_0_10_35_9]